ncbi:RNA polymerase sigma factor [Pseudonocardia nigra]|uniref:RNA polymerase sigma factor n=1 Tax=Pseudonocardia nigra TaxID=1921578 RepID=UPI001C5CEE8F|nr:sigma-70 family RNA polymerase sigma factor [Pseudonocardia nigra]
MVDTAGGRPAQGLTPGDDRSSAAAVPDDDVSDIDLHDRLASGDQAALGLMIDRYIRPAWSLARRICRDAEIAEEVVQEVFLALWREPGRYDPQRGPFAAWLRTLVHHKAVDLVRREDRWHRREESPPDLTESGADESAMAAILAGKLRDALQQLPDQQRRTLILAYFGGYTQREIAQITAVPLGTVKSRTATALERLRAAIARFDDDHPERSG